MSLGLAALCATLKHEVLDQTTALARSYTETRHELHALQQEHRLQQWNAEDDRAMLRIRNLRMEDQVTEARDEVEEAEATIDTIQTRVKDAMNDIARYRYTRDDKYLGRAMAMLESSLGPQDIKESDHVISIMGGAGRLEGITPSGMGIVAMSEEDTMPVPMHDLMRAV